MSNLINSINENINNMHRITKKVFTYSLIISAISFWTAAFSFIFARVYWNYYDILNSFSELFLQVFQLFTAAIIVSFMVEIFLKAKDN